MLQHQQNKSDCPLMTNSNGHPIDNNQETLTLGPTGPILLQDVNYIEKLAHFDRERVPERVVHAKGFGAHGYFEVTKNVTKYCKAKFLDKVGKKTPILARFSTVRGERGAPDTRRDPRGFAVKFYTEEGNWDMVGNNVPVFFVNDPIKFPDLIHAIKRNPQTNLVDNNMFWDFFSQTPESVHLLTMVFSDRGIPNGFRHMHGFGNHTFKWVNKKDEVTFVKFHFISNQGIQTLTDDEGVKLEGEAPEYAALDLFNAIENKDYPSWTFYIQTMTEEQASQKVWDVLDVTKIWPHAEFPLIEVGKMVLDKNIENYHAEIEQVAFSPGSLVPEMEPSNDKLLQGRLFSYPDTQRYRIGPNYQQLPVNCPYRTRVVNDQRDGPMAMGNNQGSRLNYNPSCFRPYSEDRKYHITQYEIQGMIGKYTYNDKSDHFSQPRALFEKVMTEKDREHLFHNIAGKLKQAVKEIQIRQCQIFYRVHPDYGKGVATLLGIPFDKIISDDLKESSKQRTETKDESIKQSLEQKEGLAGYS